MEPDGGAPVAAGDLPASAVRKHKRRNDPGAARVGGWTGVGMEGTGAVETAAGNGGCRDRLGRVALLLASVERLRWFESRSSCCDWVTARLACVVCERCGPCYSGSCAIV